MKILCLAVMLVAAGCAAAVGTSGSTYVPKDAPRTCASHCSDMGLQLTSVVVMANNVGCVCSAAAPNAPAAPGTPTPAPASPGVAPAAADGSGAAAGGMAALLIQQAQRTSRTEQTPASTAGAAAR